MKCMARPKQLSDKGTDNKAFIMDVGIASTSLSRVLKKIDSICRSSFKKRPCFIITAYSEFIQQAQKDNRFKRILNKADLVVPDGVVILAALDYLALPQLNALVHLWQGLGIGWNILTAKYSNRVIGVKLVEQLLQKRKHRIFLLGGWQGVASSLAGKYGCGYYQPSADISLATKPERGEMLEAVNNYAPDVLLVALGRFKQEHWIFSQLNSLKAKVVIGVGSAFDELAGVGYWKKPTPEWIDKMGLKWLWRAIVHPAHLGRAFNAFPVFAWQVFRYKNSHRG